MSTIKCGKYHKFAHGFDKNMCDENGNFDLTIAEQIASQGLSCGYMTTFRTMRQVGDDLDYRYMSNGQGVYCNVLVAIPDYFVVDGKVVPVLPQDIREQIPTIDDGAERSLVDIVTKQKDGTIVVPKQFVYGYYLFDGKTAQVLDFVQNDQHFSQLSLEEQVAFVDDWQEKLKQKGMDYLLAYGEKQDQTTLTTARAMAELQDFSESGVRQNIVDQTHHIVSNLNKEQCQ